MYHFLSGFTYSVTDRCMLTLRLYSLSQVETICGVREICRW